MANEIFYISNYLPPPAVTSRGQVMEIQRQLNANGANLKVDGIWGPQTSAAYTANGGDCILHSNPVQELSFGASNPACSANGAIRADLGSAVSFADTGRIAAGVRYGDRAAQGSHKDQQGRDRRRRRSARHGCFHLGQRTSRTRQSGYEADDIATMEGQYNATVSNALMNALQSEKTNRLAVDQTNAQLTADAQAQALSLAGEFLLAVSGGL